MNHHFSLIRPSVKTLRAFRRMPLAQHFRASGTELSQPFSDTVAEVWVKRSYVDKEAGSWQFGKHQKSKIFATNKTNTQPCPVRIYGSLVAKYQQMFVDHLTVFGKFREHGKLQKTSHLKFGSINGLQEDFEIWSCYLSSNYIPPT